MPRSSTRDLLASLAGIVIASIGFGAYAQAATFTMSNGTVVEGDIIDKMAGNAIIRSTIGYAVNSQINAIEAVVILLRDGRTVRGTLVDWENGSYVIRHENDNNIMVIQLGAEGDYLLQSITTREQAQPVRKASPTLVQQAAPEPALPPPSVPAVEARPQAIVPAPPPMPKAPAIPPVVTKPRQPTM